MESHTLTLATCSYVLLVLVNPVNYVISQHMKLFALNKVVHRKPSFYNFLNESVQFHESYYPLVAIETRVK